MSETILYLFGAGASAQALPLVKGSSDGAVQGLSNALKGLSVRLQNEHPQQGFSGNFIKYIKKQFSWIEDESNRHDTIDTYAKSLYIKGEHKKLNDLKLSLAIFFIIEQVLLKKVDKRYNIWLSSILPNTQLFPDNVKVLTWNYDFQLQLAASTYRSESFRYSGSVFVSTPPIVKYFPPMGNFFPHTTSRFNPSDFNMIHLNGIAGLFFEKSKNYFDNIFVNSESITQDLEAFIKNPDDFVHLLTFAWETNSSETDLTKRRLEFAKSIIQDTTILCVIGYSFPRFNKPYDTEIFNVLNKNNQFKKIYIQDPNAQNYTSFFHTQFNVQTQVLVEPISNVQTFHIPYEL